jgi:hypothetical protein
LSRMPGTITPLGRIALALGLASLGVLGFTGCTQTGTVAGPVALDGRDLKLIDADPCIFNGDSGCASRSLGGSDGSLCVRRGDTLRLHTGSDTTSVTATAGQRGDHEAISNRVSNGRIELQATRTDSRHYAISIPRDAPRNLRVMHLSVRYARGVLTPYAPVSDWLTADDPKPFRRGIYALRIRVAPCKQT